MKVVFLDKDGTLIPDVPYNVNPQLISIEKNSVEGLKRLQDNGFALIIVSNQAGIGKGFFKEDDLLQVEKRLKELLKEEGIDLNAFYYCPHTNEDNCWCRKPQPGMFLKASEDFKINLLESWMIGDILNDVEAGNRAGCKTILIDNGNETEWIINEYRKPNFKVKHINEAAEIIIKETNYSRISTTTSNA